MPHAVHCTTPQHGRRSGAEGEALVLLKIPLHHHRVVKRRELRLLQFDTHFIPCAHVLGVSQCIRKPLLLTEVFAAKKRSLSVDHFQEEAEWDPYPPPILLGKRLNVGIEGRVRKKESPLSLVCGTDWFGSRRRRRLSEASSVVSVGRGGGGRRTDHTHLGMQRRRRRKKLGIGFWPRAVVVVTYRSGGGGVGSQKKTKIVIQTVRSDVYR